jgi:phage I-like protein
LDLCRSGNLLPYVRTQLALKLESEYAARAKKNQGSRTDIPQISAKSEVTPIDTRKEIAKLAGVSHDTVAKVKKIEALATAETKAALALDLCRSDFSKTLPELLHM